MKAYANPGNPGTRHPGLLASTRDAGRDATTGRDDARRVWTPTSLKDD